MNNSVEIERLDPQQGQTALPELVSLLQDAVDSDASLGFWKPMEAERATQYWQGVFKKLAEGYQMLLVARQGGKIVGTAQLELNQKQNGSHRAEIQKVLVHRTARRQGIAQALMLELEGIAKASQRKIIVLDTLRDGGAEPLYLKLGYIKAGVVPAWTIEVDGTYGDTVFYYRWLDA